jgi:hypothetical protein
MKAIGFYSVRVAFFIIRVYQWFASWSFLGAFPSNANMKHIVCSFVLTLGCFLATIVTADARVIQPWSYQQLLDKSDLVVIATPTATGDTKEHIALPGFEAQRVIGVETRFAVSAVLKGDKAIKDLVLHHYRSDVKETPRDIAAGYVPSVPNGPTFVYFEPAKKREFLIFLVREADGRYAPAFGQVDPGVCGISMLGGAW